MIKALMMGVALLGLGCAVDVGTADAENIDSTEQAVTAQGALPAEQQGGADQAALSAAPQGGADQAALLAAQQAAMQEQQMAFDMQFLQLQSQMQHENRSYSAVANIMKTKHDTAKNSISNVR